MKRYLIVRLGAFGDCLIITSLLRYLKQGGNEVYLLTSEQGEQVFANNPYIDKIKIHERDSIANENLRTYFESIQQAWECDELIDLCESIEVNLSLYPADPRYNYPKQEKIKLCNKNFYEETFRFAGINPIIVSGLQEFDFGKLYNPELFFTPQEERAMQGFFKQFKDWFVVLWGLSGSSRNKTYPTPYMFETVEALCQKYDDIVFITVGDELCQILEGPFEKNKRVIRKSGLWAMRESMLACKYASLVISPDTGLLHASGCFDTPKIGLLTHATKENITKHFKNDYSLEPEGVSCAPCFRIMYQADVQCNLADDRITPMCLAYGMTPERVIKQIERAKNVACNNPDLQK